MRNIKKLASCLLAGIIIAGSLSSCSSETPKEEIDIKKITFTQQQTEDIAQSIDTFLTDEKFSGTAYADMNNQEFFFKSFGNKEPSKKSQLKNNQSYQLGSVTKIFTGLAIMRLEADKKISLTDKLSDYFSGYKYLKKITIKDLLEMKSGFGSYLDDIVKDKKLLAKLQKEIKKKPNNPDINGRIEAYILKKGLKYETGEYHYSNTGYFLLGRIISKFSKDGFYGYLKKAVIKPLKLKHISLVNPTYGTWGYNEKTKKWVLPSSASFLNDYYVMYSSMGIIASAEDVKTVVNEFLKPDNLKKIMSTDSPFNYGFHIDGNTLYAEGSTTLHSAYVYVDIDRNIKSITLSNHHGMKDFDVVSTSIYNAINSKVNGILLENS